ncbi:MFS transporter [Moraxella cuniculi]|uniref:Major Facilitator Superfamily n=1 Tax=Moraxella cuniculi TaxID=34061 RepID=A0A448GXG4_9GAMM|nr:MFS transporter [Moraxella cuniculi]VEG13455.1 Major Facilitator Superfamily [Moraxella cuniculi]
MMLQDNGYIFKPHELPMMAGSPATPDMSGKRRLLYGLTGFFLAVAAGLQNGLMTANIANLRGELGLTLQEGGWVTLAYFMTYTTASILFFKIRPHFGLAKFIRWTLLLVLASNVLQVFFRSYEVEIIARLMMGMGTSGLFTLGVLYAMLSVAGMAKVALIVILSGLMQVAATLALIITPNLFDDGNMQAVFVFQGAITALATACVLALRLPPTLEQKSLSWRDVLSFVLYTVGIALLCAFLIQGQIVWWTTDWLGYLLALAVLAIGLMMLIELNRAKPLIDWRWALGRNMLMFLIISFLTRVFTAEQGTGANGFLQALGLTTSQLITYYTIIGLSSVAGIVLSVIRLDIKDIRRPIVVALFGIALGSYLDIGVSSQTPVSYFYISQAILAFSSFYFAGPVMLEGMVRAMAKSTDYIVSFIAVFAVSQTLGALLGSAVFGYFITYKTREHYANISQQLTDTPANLLPNLIRQANLEATVLAYNDLFYLIFLCAGTSFVISLFAWLYRRVRGINVLANEMVALEAINPSKK